MEIFFIILWALVILMIVSMIYSFRADKNIIYSLIYSKRTDEKLKRKEILGVYYLPETILLIESTIKIKVKLDKNENIVSTEVLQKDYKFSSIVQSDTKNQFLFLKNLSNHLSSDELKFGVNEFGLLENLEVTSEDKSPQIFSTLTFQTQESKKSAASLIPFEIVRVEEREYTKTFNLNIWESMLSEVSFNWILPVSYPTKMSVQDAGFNIKSETLKNLESNYSSDPFNGADLIPGILLRKKVKTNLILTENISKEEIKISNVYCFDKGSFYPISFKSLPFVKRKQEILFKNGDIQSFIQINPSSIHGFLSIPIDIGKALISIPAQLISIKIAKVNEEIKLQKAVNELSLEIDKSNKDRIEKEKKESQIDATKKELLEYQKKLYKSEANLAQLKVDSALEFMRLEKEIQNLKNQ